LPAEHSDRDRPAGHRAFRTSALAICAAGLAIVAAAAGCGKTGGHSAELAPLKLRHSPPVGLLTREQLRSLSMECEQYPQNRSMRGRYDAAYCDEAIAAWADSPLQMVTIPVEPRP